MPQQQRDKIIDLQNNHICQIKNCVVCRHCNLALRGWQASVRWIEDRYKDIARKDEWAKVGAIVQINHALSELYVEEEYVEYPRDEQD